MTRPAGIRRMRLPWRRGSDDPTAELAAPELGEPEAALIEVARATRWSETFRALRHRNYRLFYTGQAISLTGTWMQTIAQAWLVIQLTDSKAAVGIVTALQFLPITLRRSTKHGYLTSRPGESAPGRRCRSRKPPLRRLE